MTYTPHGRHLIAGEWVASRETFGSDPASGPSHEFSAGSADLVAAACASAEAAFDAYSTTTRAARAQFLEAIAAEIEARAAAITEIGHQETGLPTARLEGERGRTTGQLRLFAAHIRNGDYLDRRVDAALPERQPLPRPEIRLMQRPIGPVAVFGASNFPLAFSTAGGDTASALAAGCPVVVKGHSAHPGTSEIVAEAVLAAIHSCQMPSGVFALIQGGHRNVGTAIVTNPLIKAVGFTGSLTGGRALFELCAARPEPIPFFGELGSVNPMFILPGAILTRSEGIAAGWAGSDVRPHYARFAQWLARQSAESMQARRAEAEVIFRRVGITFAVYGAKDEDGAGTERLIPFDLIPRIIPQQEWAHMQRGLVQRVTALNRFIHDVYHGQDIIRAGIVPADLILNNAQYRPEMAGLHVPQNIYSHIAGIDIVRAPNAQGEGEYYVLEDNLRVPSGVSYMLEDRKMMMRLFPELFAQHQVSPVAHYPDLLLACDPQDREPYYRRRPCLVVEVLSPSTERIDRREKLFAYQTIPSLREYLLVDPDRRCVEVYRFGETVRHETFTEGGFWLDCLGAEITLDDVYVDAEAL